MGIVNEQANSQRRAPSCTGMSEEIPNIIPIKKKHQQSAGDDILARLEKLEDSFITGLQEIRAVKSELKKRADSIDGLEKLLDAKAVAELLGEKERSRRKRYRRLNWASIGSFHPRSCKNG